MTALMSVLLAALPNIFVAIFAKIFTQAFMQEIIEKVLIYSLRKAAKMTTNTVDDDLVEEIAKRLQSGGENA